MDLRAGKMGAHGQGQALRSMSQHALNRDHKTPVEGLRKLAATYRNTVRTDKIEVDKFRSGSREKQTLIDPRFRRERTRSPKRASHSRSESQFSASHEQVHTHSAPTFIAKPLPMPKEEPKPITAEVRKNENDTSENVSVIMQEKDLEIIEHEDDALVSSSLENQVNSLGKSLTEDEITSKPNVINKDNDTASTNSLSIKKRRNSWGGNRSVIRMNYVNKNAYWDDPRLLKKYANLLGGAKRTKSSMTLPFALPKLPDGSCMCMKCSCVKDRCGEYTFDDNTEVDTNSLLLDPQAVLKEHLNGSYYMTVFYLIGCVCGLVLVAFIAWILSNDLIWNLVNYRESQKKNSYVYAAASYVGGVVLFTLNLIFGSIYNIFVLPRNAVFKSADEPWSPWQYIK